MDIMKYFLPVLALCLCHCEFVTITDSSGNPVARRTVEGPRPSYYGEINQQNFERWLPRVGKGEYKELSVPELDVWTTYTGRLKTYSTPSGQILAVVRETKTSNPTAAFYGRSDAITTWQGGNPNTGYYGRRKLIERIYE